MSKKPTEKQLRARKLFAMRVRRGDFKKSKNTKNNLKVKKMIESKTAQIERELAKFNKSNFSKVRPSMTRRDRGGSFSDIDKSLLLAIHDPNVKEIIIKK